MARVINTRRMSQIKLKLMFSPPGLREPTSKISRISCCFRLVLPPNGTTATNDAVDHIYKLTAEAITDGIDALWALYISSGCGVLQVHGTRQAARTQGYVPASVCE